MQKILERLSCINLFSKEQFRNIYWEETKKCSDDAVSYALRKLLASGKIIRAGWNQYAVPQNKVLYNHSYSDESSAVANYILQKYPDALFQIFELIQLNNFVNHQIAHNTIFVYVENELVDFVFDSMNGIYTGRILLKPNVSHYYRYLQDDMIVVGRLPSESPKGLEESWHSRLEKVLVDIAIDKLLSNIVPSGEVENIYDEAFSRYLVDEKTMFRYAKRKGAEQKYKRFLSQYAPYVLEERE